MLQPIQGPDVVTGQVTIRIELAGAVTKDRISCFEIDADSGALTHRNQTTSGPDDNTVQYRCWGVAKESGETGDFVEFVLKGVVGIDCSNAGGAIAIGDALTPRGAAGYSNVAFKAATGEIEVASATKAHDVASGVVYCNFDGMQHRYEVA